MKQYENALPRYTKWEEIHNSVSHGIGAILGIIGTVILIINALTYSDTIGLVSVIIYGITMVTLYSMSTVYHAVTKQKLKSVMQICDHCSIFLLIAGTYTPFTLIALRGTIGYTLFAVIWGVAIFGIILNIVSLKKYEKLSMVCYLAMGWSVVFAIKPLIAALTSVSLTLLVVGGLFYTVGLIFYAMKKHRYMHSIWHIFVLGGSLTHFISILLYIRQL